MRWVHVWKTPLKRQCLKKSLLDGEVGGMRSHGQFSQEIMRGAGYLPGAIRELGQQARRGLSPFIGSFNWWLTKISNLQWFWIQRQLGCLNGSSNTSIHSLAGWSSSRNQRCNCIYWQVDWGDEYSGPVVKGTILLFHVMSKQHFDPQLNAKSHLTT